MFLGDFNPYLDSIQIIKESTKLSITELKDIEAVFEDVEHPVRNKYIEKLYDSVLSKGHVDFDDIPNSKGDLEQYKGYADMISILNNINQLAQDNNGKQVMTYVSTIQASINNLIRYKDLYMKGFKLRNDYIMLEYNTFVYCCVESISSLIYEFVDYIKRPDKEFKQFVLKNTTTKAELFYIEQLQKFNNIVSKMNYKNFLEGMLSNDKDNFIGAETIVGIATVSAIALAIVPVTREIVYDFYHCKSKISDGLAQQAYFLEMNKVSVEANSALSDKKKKEILMKQEKLEKSLFRLSNKLRVDHIQALNSSKKALNQDNSLLTIDKIKTGIDNEELSLM